MPPEERPAPDRRLMVRIIHIAIAFGIFIFYAVVSFVQLSSSGPDFGPPNDALRIVGYAVLVGAAVAAWMARQRIRGPAADEPVSDWWARNQGRAVLVWALLDTAGLGAIVLGWISGSTTLMGGGVIVSLLLLFITRPGNLERPA